MHKRSRTADAATRERDEAHAHAKVNAANASFAELNPHNAELVKKKEEWIAKAAESLAGTPVVVSPESEEVARRLIVALHGRGYAYHIDDVNEDTYYTMKSAVGALRRWCVRPDDEGNERVGASRSAGPPPDADGDELRGVPGLSTAVTELRALTSRFEALYAPLHLAVTARQGDEAVRAAVVARRLGESEARVIDAEQRAEALRAQLGAESAALEHANRRLAELELELRKTRRSLHELGADMERINANLHEALRLADQESAARKELERQAFAANEALEAERLLAFYARRDADAAREALENEREATAVEQNVNARELEELRRRLEALSEPGAAGEDQAFDEPPPFEDTPDSSEHASDHGESAGDDDEEDADRFFSATPYEPTSGDPESTCSMDLLVDCTFAMSSVRPDVSVRFKCFKDLLGRRGVTLPCTDVAMYTAMTFTSRRVWTVVMWNLQKLRARKDGSVKMAAYAAEPTRDMDGGFSVVNSSMHATKDTTSEVFLSEAVAVNCRFSRSAPAPGAPEALRFVFVPWFLSQRFTLDLFANDTTHTATTHDGMQTAMFIALSGDMSSLTDW